MSVFQMMTKIVYGIGSLKELPKELSVFGVKRPWIVTDPGIAASGVLEHVVDVLQGAGLQAGVFSGVTPTAKVATIDESWSRALDHKADGVIALGGGSALVVGKATGVLGGAVSAGEGAASIREFAFKPPVNVMPVIAIPTTAGSGAEVSPNLPMVDEERARKVTVTSPACYPRVAILDAGLLRTVPFVQAARSGVDALTHAIEACLTDRSTALTDGLALEAMQILMMNLRQACMTADLQSKQCCLEASTMANMACTNAKLGYVHGLARNVQTLFNVPYGVTIGIFLPPVLEFNLAAAPQRFARMAPYLGVNTEGLNLLEQGEAAIAAVKRLLADLDFPRKFSETEVDRSAIPRMAKMVFARHVERDLTPEELNTLDVSGYAPSPNVRKATFQQIVNLYEQAMQGWTLA